MQRLDDNYESERQMIRIIDFSYTFAIWKSSKSGNVKRALFSNEDILIIHENKLPERSDPNPATLSFP